MGFYLLFFGGGEARAREQALLPSKTATDVKTFFIMLLVCKSQIKMTFFSS